MLQPVIRTGIISSLLFSATLMSGCQSTGVAPISHREYHPVISDPATIEVFEGKPASKYTEIAFVDSFVHSRTAPSVKADQLRDLQEKAQSVGADAIIEVAQYTEDREGMIADPTIPWHSWKQGDYELYFLRGVAVRLGDNSAEWETSTGDSELKIDDDYLDRSAGSASGGIDLDSLRLVSLEEETGIERPFADY